MPTNDDEREAVQRVRDQRAARDEHAAPESAQARDDEFEQMRHEMADSVKRAEAMGDRVERAPGTMPPPDDGSEDPREG